MRVSEAGWGILSEDVLANGIGWSLHHFLIWHPQYLNTVQVEYKRKQGNKKSRKYKCQNDWNHHQERRQKTRRSDHGLRCEGKPSDSSFSCRYFLNGESSHLPIIHRLSHTVQCHYAVSLYKFHNWQLFHKYLSIAHTRINLKTQMTTTPAGRVLHIKGLKYPDREKRSLGV